MSLTTKDLDQLDKPSAGLSLAEFDALDASIPPIRMLSRAVAPEPVPEPTQAPVEEGSLWQDTKDFVTKDIPNLATTAGARGISALQQGAGGAIQFAGEIDNRLSQLGPESQRRDPSIESPYVATGKGIYAEGRMINDYVSREKPFATKAGEISAMAAESIMQMIPSLAVGAVNPPAGLAIMGGITAGQKFGENRADGKDFGDSATNAVWQGAVEAATEAIPMLKFFDLFKPGTKSLLRKVGEYYGAEIVTEHIATALQNGADAYFTEDEPMPQRVGRAVDYLQSDQHFNDQVDTFLVTALQSTIMGGGAVGIRKVGEAFSGETDLSTGQPVNQPVAPAQPAPAYDDVAAQSVSAVPQAQGMEQVPVDDQVPGAGKMIEPAAEEVSPEALAVDIAAHEAATSPMNDRTDPTEAQTKAGNYKKGKVQIQGLDVSIENPKGSIRKGKDDNGNPWASKLTAHYGYIRKTEGSDGDQVDVFLAPGAETAETAYIIDQIDPKTGLFDEHKIVLGPKFPEGARTTYLSNYDQSGQSRLGAITEMPMERFKAWLKEGDTKAPVSHNVKTADLADTVTQPPAVERRKNSARRQKISAMTPEQIEQELYTSKLTGLQNRRAWDETEKKPVQASVDLDSLKWINDELGHQTGDDMLRAVGQAFQEEGVDAYHVSGDEFLSHGATAEELEEALSRVAKRLEDATIEVTLPNGSKVIKKGLGFSYGYGQDIAEAEQRLQEHKQERQQTGQRAARGEEPPGVFLQPAEGQQDQGQPVEKEGLDADRKSFIEGKVKELGSLKAVEAKYKEDAPVDRYAREFAKEHFADVGKETKAGQVSLIKTPSGRFKFAGKVPAEMTYAYKDGKGLSDKDIKAIQQSSNPAMTMKQLGVESLTWETARSAQLVASSQGYSIENWSQFEVDEGTDKNIGREWDSPYGRQKIVSREDMPSGDMYDVQTIGKDEIRRYNVNRIDEIVKRNEHETTPAFAKEREERKEIQRIKEERDARQAEAEKKTLDEIAVFTKNLSQIQAGRARLALLAKMSFDGKVMTRKEYVEAKIAEGRTVQGEGADRRLENSDGAGLDIKALTKTAMDYAEFISDRTPAAQKAPTPKTEIHESPNGAGPKVVINTINMEEERAKYEQEDKERQAAVQELPPPPAPPNMDEFNKRRDEMFAGIDALEPQMLRDAQAKSGPKANRVFMDIWSRRGNHLELVSAPHNGTEADAFRVGGLLRFYMSEELENATMRGSFGFITNAQGQPTWGISQGEGQPNFTEMKPNDRAKYASIMGAIPEKTGQGIDAELSSLSMDDLSAMFDEVAGDTEDARTAKRIAEEAAKAGVRGVDAAMKGLVELFGGTDTLKSFPAGLDPDTYAKAKPHFAKALSEFRAAGKGMKEFLQFVIENFSAKIKPYLMHFLEEAKNGDTITVQEDTNEPAGDGITGETALEGSQPRRVSPDATSQRPGIRGDSLSATDAEGDAGPDGSGDVGSGSLASESGTVYPDGPGPGLSPVDYPTPASEPKPAALTGDNPGDYRITAADRIGEGTRGERIDNNLAAIRLVKELESANRFATPKEQATLARYVGWGGLKSVFDPTSKKPQDQNARQELERLLTKQEYFDARQSVLNAHYTSREVIGAMYDFVEHFGFTGGNVLEPTFGVGNFIGLMPDALSASSKWYGSELDTVSATIGKHLYPASHLINTGFQEAEFPYGKFDLAIGNPPFGDERLTDRNKGRKDISGMKIHNYVLAKSAKHLRPGGILSMVVTSRFLDTADTEGRAYLAKTYKLLGAIRLPNNAFAKNAGTEVTTDLVFFQRLMSGEKPDQGADWLQTGATMQNAAGETVTLNKYFAKRPHLMMGEASMAGTMYGGNREEFTLSAPADQDTPAKIRETLSTSFAHLANIFDRTDPDQADAAAMSLQMNRDDVGVGGFIQEGPDIFLRLDDDASGNQQFTKLDAKTPWSPRYAALDAAHQAAKAGDLKAFEAAAKELGTSAKNKTALQKALEKAVKTQKLKGAVHAILNAKSLSALGETRLERIQGIMALRVATYNLIEAERFDRPGIEKQRRELNRSYDAFVQKFGFINDNANASLMSDDVKIEFGLESNYRKPITAARAKALGSKPSPAVAEKAAILSERVFFPYKEVTSADSTRDGYEISLSEKGRLDLNYIAKITGKKLDEVTAELSEAGLIFEDPESGAWIQEDAYLSGNVKAKLRAAESRNGFERNVEALREVLPADKPAEKIFVDLGATWVPAKIYEDFADFMGIPNAKVRVIEATGRVMIASSSEEVKNAINVTLDNPDYKLFELFNMLANKQAVVAYDHDADGKRVVNKDRTKALTPIAKKFSGTFRDWVFADQERSRTLAEVYNETQNTHAERVFHHKHLKTVGASPAVRLRNTQKSAAWRMIQTPVVLLDHIVGAGKTFTIITGVMERRRLGLSRKPVVVVPNHLVGQWAKDFLKLYPGANILAATEKDFAKANRRRLFSRIATGTYDAIIVGHSSFQFIPLEKETEQRFVMEEIEYLERALSEAKEAGDRRTVRTITNRIQKKQERIKKLMDAPRDDVASFESMGIDYLVVDESHEYKNLEYSTAMQNVTGMGNPAGARKSFDLYSKIRLTRGNEGGVTFATGTPISNSLVEMYTILRYLNLEGLKARKLDVFDAWAKAYAGIDSKIEYTATQKLKERQVMGTFNNLVELMQLYREFADIVTMADLKRIYTEQIKALNKTNGTKEREEFPIPKVRDGARTLDIAPATEDQREYMDYLVARASRLEKLGGQNDPKTDNHLWVMNDARKMALDIRLVDPNAQSHPENKINRSARKIKSLYDKWDHVKGTQLVFCDLSTPAKQADKSAKKFIATALEKLGLKSDTSIKRLLESMSYRDQWTFLHNKFDVLMEQLSESDDTTRYEALEKYLDDISDEDTASLTTADTGFSVYDDLKKSLVDLGVPENEIRFIHEANTSAQKDEIFGQVNSGQVRIILGSTKKMGAGTNIQERAVALHHLDSPWRPSDVEQREGRVIRQENKLYEADPDGFEVEIKAYSTSNTFDAVMWQVLARKADMLEQFRSGADSIAEGQSDASSYADFMAESTGNPAFKEKFQLEAQIEELEATERNVLARLQSAKRTLDQAEASQARAQDRIQEATAALEAINAADAFTYQGKRYKDDIEPVVERLQDEYREAMRVFEQETFPAYEQDMKNFEADVEAGRYKDDKKAETKARPKKPVQPHRPTLADTVGISETGNLVKEINDALVATEDGNEVEFSFGGVDIVIEKVQAQKGSHAWTLRINGAHMETRESKEPSPTLMNRAFSSAAVQKRAKNNVEWAQEHLERTKKDISEAQIIAKSLSFADADTLKAKRERHNEVVEEVNRLEAEMTEKRKTVANHYVGRDRKRFPSGKWDDGSTPADAPVSQPEKREAAPVVTTNATVEDGLPMDSYKPAREKPSKIMGQNKSFYTGPIDGKPAYSNGQFALVGEIPEAMQEKVSVQDIDKNMQKVVPEDPGEPVKAVGYSEGENEYGKQGRYVWLESGRIDADYYDYILRQYPDATFRKQEGDKSAITIYSKDERVGLVMPVSEAVVPVGIRSLRGENPATFMREISGSGMTEAEAYQAIAAPLQALPSSIEVHLVGSESELPHYLQDAIELTRGESEVKAVLDELTGRDVYLIAGRFEDAADIQRGLLHEVSGHIGLRNLLGADFVPVLNQVYHSFPQRVKDTAKDYGFDLRRTLHKQMAAEEILAQIAENNEHPSLIRRAIEAIKTWLAKHGFTVKYTDADLVAMIARGKKKLSKGGVVNGNRPYGQSTQQTYLYGPATGSEPGAFTDLTDRKAKVEMDDSGARLKNLRTDSQGLADRATSLGDVLHHPELFKVYPDMKDIDLLLMIDPGMRDPRGVYTPRTDRSGEGLFDLDERLEVYAKNEQDARETILHEIQHAIQHRADFARGGAPVSGSYEIADRAPIKLAYDAFTEVMTKSGFNINDIPEMDMIIGDTDILDDVVADLGRMSDDYHPEVEWAADALARAIEDNSIDGYEQYRRLSGEEEARRVSARADMTEGQRTGSPYGRTDVSNPKHLITRFDGATMQRKRAHGTAEQEAALEATMVTPAAEMTIKERVSNLVRKAANVDAMALRQGALDGFASIEGYEKDEYGQVLDAAISPSKAARLTKNLDSVLAAVMLKGALVYRNGSFQLENAKDGKGFAEIFAPLTDHKDGNLLRLWEGWAAAVRANRLMQEGRERNFTQEQIDALLPLEVQYPLFRQIFDEYQAFNSKILDLAEATGVIDGEARAEWEKNDYIPFYRVVEEVEGSEKTKGPFKKKGLANQRSGIVRLRGGEGKINVMENMILNASKLIDASFKNIAMQRIVDLTEATGAVEEISKTWKPVMVQNSMLRKALEAAGILPDNETAAMNAIDLGQRAGEFSDEEMSSWSKLLARWAPQGKDVISVLYNGKPRYFKVHDPLLYRAVTSMGPDTMDGMLGLMRGAKRLLTASVTVNPAFMAANFLRDTLSTWVVTDTKMTPFLSASKQFIRALGTDENMLQMMASGAGGGGYYHTRKTEVRKFIGDQVKVMKSSNFQNTVLNSPRKAWRFYQKIGAATESANRLVVFEHTLRKGGSLAEAAYQAMDVLNFTRTGDAALMRFLTQTVPFLNARIQGLDRLYRGGKENPKAFMLKGLILTGATIALYALNSGNPDYEDLPEWDKDLYWHFFTPFGHFRMPKPFEVGAIFATVPERMMGLIRDQEGKVFADRMIRMFLDTFAFEPLPQLFKPVVEQVANKSFFKDSPIVPLHLQRLEPEAQYEPWTSETLRSLAEGMPDAAPEFLRSPKRLEHMLYGYLSSVSSYALMASDAILREAGAYPDAPKGTIQDMPVVNRFMREDAPRSTKYSSQFYEMANEAQTVYSTIRKYRQQGDAGKADRLLADNKQKLQARPTLNKVQKRLSDINNRIRLVWSSREVSREEKQRRVDALNQERNRIQKLAVERYGAAF